MTYNMRGNCWHCGQSLEERDYAREGTCPKCGRQTHVCRNCRYYDTSRPNACSEPIADPVPDKMRANFCGYFEAREQAAASGHGPDDALRQAADDLFDL